MRGPEPEWRCLHGALQLLHSRILYDEVGMDFIGYSEKLFERSHRVARNRTLADHLVWIMRRGGRLRATVVRNGRFTGPSLGREELLERWGRLAEADRLERDDEAWAVRVLRCLFRISEPS